MLLEIELVIWSKRNLKNPRSSLQKELLWYVEPYVLATKLQAFPAPSKQWHRSCAPHRKHPKAHRSMPIWCEHLDVVYFCGNFSKEFPGSLNWVILYHLPLPVKGTRNSHWILDWYVLFFAKTSKTLSDSHYIILVILQAVCTFGIGHRTSVWNMMSHCKICYIRIANLEQFQFVAA